MLAKYDLREAQPCFDFFTWLVHVKAQGATEIILQTKTISPMLMFEWGLQDVRRRAKSILFPGPALAGLPCRECVNGEEGQIKGTASFSKFLENYKPDYNFPRLKTVLPPKQVDFTVTLRKSKQEPWRNSDEKLWRGFAADIGALVIEDYSVKPIHLHERMALYAGATMNFFVLGGPSHLLYFTDYPFMVFGCEKRIFEKRKFYVGEKFAWFNSNQHLVWEPISKSTLWKYGGAVLNV